MEAIRVSISGGCVTDMHSSYMCFLQERKHVKTLTLITKTEHRITNSFSHSHHHYPCALEIITDESACIYLLCSINILTHFYLKHRTECIFTWQQRKWVLCIIHNRSQYMSFWAPHSLSTLWVIPCCVLSSTVMLRATPLKQSHRTHC